MPESELISIIIPAFQVEGYLRQCIESVLQQTYQSLEIILVDDGSLDNCGIICEEYARKDKRVHCYHKANEGISSARNYGLERAHGEWIGFVDADDWVESEMFERMLAAAHRSAAEVAVCGYYYEYMNGSRVSKSVEHETLLCSQAEIASGFYVQRV